MKKYTAILLVLALLVLSLLPVAAQDDGVITIGTNAEFPPFEAVDEDGNIIGFDIDLMTALAEDAGLEIQFVNTRWDGIFVALSEGEFDAVISAATITEEREEVINFTDPYFNAGQGIYVGAEEAANVLDVDDLVGFRVGVQLGTTGDEYASELTGVEVVRFDEVTLAYQALGTREIDAVITDIPTGDDIIANNPELEAVRVGEPLTDEFYGIAVNEELTDLLDALNIALENVIASGEYAEIYEEWFGALPSAEFMPEDMDEMEVEATEEASG
jgi:ABC-type amino acid transport substrate-binding protein